MIPSDDQSSLFDDGSFSTRPDATDVTIVALEDQGRGTSGDDGTALTRSLPSTLTEALVFVQQHNLVPTKVLEDARSAVKVLEKVIRRDADKLPAVPKDLTPLIESAFPARFRIKPKRWSNAISLIRRLLRACGLHARLVRGKRPSDPAWATLLNAILDRNERLRILGFACWCSDAGIRPDEVVEQTLADYQTFRQTKTIRTHIVQLISSIRIFWNRGVKAQLPGWPTRLLATPPHPYVEALPLSSFPVDFQNDLSAYLTKRTTPEPFDGNHEIWRSATAIEVRRFLIRAASLVARKMGGPANVGSLAEIVTVESVEFILLHVHARAGGVWRENAGNFATYLLMVARDFVHVDAATLARIEELRGIVVKRWREHRKPGLSERVAERIMPFDDRKLLRRLFRLPGELYRRAGEMLKDRPVRAAQMYEQALMLDILQHDPMRRHNLATINFEADFKRDDGGRIDRLWISANRTKNGIAIDTPIPPDLAKCIETHLAVYRPHLRGASSPWLLPSPKGTPRALTNVTKTLGRTVTRSLGVTFTPHMMRHIIATLLYRTNPNSGVVVQRILRHANIKTTERAYGMMSNAGSSAAWQEDLNRYRRADRGRKHRSRVTRRKDSAD